MQPWVWIWPLISCPSFYFILFFALVWFLLFVLFIWVYKCNFLCVAEEVRPTRATRASARRGKKAATPARGTKTRRGRAAAASESVSLILLFYLNVCLVCWSLLLSTTHLFLDFYYLNVRNAFFHFVNCSANAVDLLETPSTPSV